MSAALAGTTVAAARTPTAAKAVQCFKGSLHVCGHRRAQPERTPLPSRPIAWAAAGDLKKPLHDGSGYFLLSVDSGKSETWVSHKRRMSPFYKASVTVT